MSENDQVGDSTGIQADHEVALDCRAMGNRRLWGALAALGVVCLAFIPVLLGWSRIALGSDLHSHVVLIPGISVYLLVINRRRLVWDSPPSVGPGIAVLLLSGMLVAWRMIVNPAWSAVDLTALEMLSWVGCVWGIGLCFAGSRWMRSAVFPMTFLLFLIPLPDFAVTHLEHFLMTMSAHLAEVVFSLGSIPVYKNGQVLELPGMVLEVVNECSGIRSSWVLLITSVLASYLFLPTLPRRLILVAAVLPIGILRNAVRIYVIGWLCVNHGPAMIDSWIHRKGGPVFFIASLVPLLVMAWWMRARPGKHDPES